MYIAYVVDQPLSVAILFKSNVTKQCLILNLSQWNKFISDDCFNSIFCSLTTVHQSKRVKLDNNFYYKICAKSESKIWLNIIILKINVSMLKNKYCLSQCLVYEYSPKQFQNFRCSTYLIYISPCAILLFYELVFITSNVGDSVYIAYLIDIQRGNSCFDYNDRFYQSSL
ncbi:Uncharacterized protein FWK35_00022579 [Aphis craccivora]|uniref:Transmembrane protein n=1 Tax=Aphis craccivora TaxID=307492 RepID=A0A6G0Y211_APHCR|nr:Uncharacterized protein FWK35_00022579 [Aphis craccivora]